MIKSNGGIIGPDNVTTGGSFGRASGVFKLGEVTNLIKDSKWPTAGPGGFQVANSCRFNSASSDALTKTLGSGGNRKTFTISLWTKPSSVSQQQMFISADSNQFGFDNTGIIFFYENNGGTEKPYVRWSPQYRDTGAWYHVCLAIDTTQGTASNRMKLYVNGSQVTDTISATYPDQNQDLTWNTNVAHAIGRYSGSGGHYDGYMSEIMLINGSALAPTSFGEFNSQTGIWIPKDVSGLTPGTNGFYLDFKDSANLGNDAFGGTDWAEVNLTSLDQSTDTCTTNFATANSIGAQRIGGGSIRPTAYSEGSLRVVLGSSQYYTRATSTIAVPTGKWYWETKMISNCDSSADPTIGIIGTDGMQSSQTGTSPNSSMQYRYNGQKGYNNVGNASYGATWTNGDIIGIALDLTSATKTITFYKNGTTQGVAFSGDGTSDGFNPASQYWSAFWVAGGSNNATMDINMGSPAYAISSGNTDGNGFGNFEYAPPTGFLSLNTKNLAAVLA